MKINFKLNEPTVLGNITGALKEGSENLLNLATILKHESAILAIEASQKQQEIIDSIPEEEREKILKDICL